MTNNQWRTLFGVLAAVVAFLLTQNDVVIPPVVKVLLGAAAVALAVVRAPGETDGGAA